MTPLAYDWMIFITGAAALVLVLWFRRDRNKVYQGRRGLRVIHLGTFSAAAGYLVGLSSLVQDFGKVRWWLIAAGFLLGLALGVLASRRQTNKWESALQRAGKLPLLVEEWWKSEWFLWALMALGLVAAFLFPRPLAPLSDNFIELVSATSYVLSGFFVAFGHYVAYWARGKEREGFRLLVLPIRGTNAE